MNIWKQTLADAARSFAIDALDFAAARFGLETQPTGELARIYTERRHAEARSDRLQTIMGTVASQLTCTCGYTATCAGCTLERSLSNEVEVPPGGGEARA